MVQEYLDRLVQAEKHLTQFCIDGLKELSKRGYKGRINLEEDQDWHYSFEGGNVWKGSRYPFPTGIKPSIIEPAKIPFQDLIEYNEPRYEPALFTVAQRIEAALEKTEQIKK